jgi:serine phosphatase RsbU (regulator of sigma subunit)
VLEEANAEISRDNPEEFFVTVCACVLDARTGELEYCNAGHEPPYLLPRTGGRVARLFGGGPALCFLDEFSYQAEIRRLAPGDTLCLVTDGVIEAMNERGELYGRARLEAVLADLAPRHTAEDTVRAIREDVAKFARGAEPTDDMAIVVLRWHGPAAASTAGSLDVSEP